MDKLIQKKLKETKLQRINACRMILNIIHLSDICQYNGVDINTYLLDGIPKTIPHLTLDWPIQMVDWWLKILVFIYLRIIGNGL